MSSKLTDKRRERLMNIKKREELKDVLVYKFKEAYGAKAPHASHMIGKEVDKFVQKADVTENNLARLERRIHQRAGRDDDEVSHVSGVSAYSALTRRSSVGSTLSRSARAIASRASGRLSRNSGAQAAPKFSGAVPENGEFVSFEWSKIDEYASYLHDQDAVRARLGQLEMQEKLRADLDKQVQDSRRKKYRQRDEEQRYFHNQMVEVEQWKEMEKEKEQETKQKNARERVDRDAQLQYEKKRRDEELARQGAEEKALVQKIVQEMEHEKLRLAAKKVQQKDAMLRVMQENMEDRKVKEQQKDTQVRMEIEGMREYNRILDQQESQRASELEHRLLRQKELMEKMQENVVRQQQAKGDEDARRALRQREEADTRAVEMERNKADKLQQMRLETQDFLFAQMEEKEERKMRAGQLKNLQAKILEEDTKEYIGLEERKNNDRRRQLLEHRLDLDDQMKRKTKDTREEKYCMSEQEVQMNQQLLQVVHKTLQERDEEPKAQ